MSISSLKVFLFGAIVCALLSGLVNQSWKFEQIPMQMALEMVAFSKINKKRLKQMQLCMTLKQCQMLRLGSHSIG